MVDQKVWVLIVTEGCVCGRGRTESSAASSPGPLAIPLEMDRDLTK